MHKVVINCAYGGFCLSHKAHAWLKDHGYNFDEPMKRHNPLLVECVETLKNEASGLYARLRVVEVNSERYFIDDYDGYESVVTPEEIDQKWINFD